jgi:hypothetical protein
MKPRIRLFEDRDAEAAVDLSLRTWAPVYASLEQALGSEVFRRLHPDWREDQRRTVEDVCASKKAQVWATREFRNPRPVEVRFRATLGEEPEVEVGPWTSAG